MIVHLIARAFAALDRWADRHIEGMVTRALSDPAIKARAAAILAAQQCPDEIEPPDEIPAYDPDDTGAMEYAAALDAWADMSDARIAELVRAWSK